MEQEYRREVHQLSAKKEAVSHQPGRRPSVGKRFVELKTGSDVTSLVDHSC
jgi:hypothetical protein